MPQSLPGVLHSLWLKRNEDPRLACVGMTTLYRDGTKYRRQEPEKLFFS
jgi:hypothetical protein